MYTVVGSDRRRAAWVEGVEESDRVGLGEVVSDLAWGGEPFGGGRFGCDGELAAVDVASEDEGDDAPDHVLVDAGQRAGVDQ